WAFLPPPRAVLVASAWWAIHVPQAAASLHAGAGARIRKIAVRRSACENKVRRNNLASVKHALLAVRVVFRLAQADEIAEHEVIVGADAGRRPHDVAGRRGEIETRIAVGVIAHLGMAPHAELA